MGQVLLCLFFIQSTSFSESKYALVLPADCSFQLAHLLTSALRPRRIEPRRRRRVVSVLELLDARSVQPGSWAPAALRIGREGGQRREGGEDTAGRERGDLLPLSRRQAVGPRGWLLGVQLAPHSLQDLRRQLLDELQVVWIDGVGRERSQFRFGNAAEGNAGEPRVAHGEFQVRSQVGQPLRFAPLVHLTNASRGVALRESGHEITMEDGFQCR